MMVAHTDVLLLTRNRRHFERVQGLALGGLSQAEGN
jgi:predicted nucleic acid-binding protein